MFDLFGSIISLSSYSVENENGPRNLISITVSKRAHNYSVLNIFSHPHHTQGPSAFKLCATHTQRTGGGGGCRRVSSTSTAQMQPIRRVQSVKTAAPFHDPVPAGTIGKRRREQPHPQRRQERVMWPPLRRGRLKTPVANVFTTLIRFPVGMTSIPNKTSVP